LAGFKISVTTITQARTNSEQKKEKESSMTYDNEPNFPSINEAMQPCSYDNCVSDDVLKATPFDNGEEAWFWFISAQQAKNEGARVVANMGKEIRPCEPIDIFKILDRLYRNRVLTMHHFKVLRHYGRRGFAPDVDHLREQRAAHLWREAFMRLEPILVRKGIILERAQSTSNGHKNWEQEAIVYSKIGSQEADMEPSSWM
jgi:hypothetical protein